MSKHIDIVKVRSIRRETPASGLRQQQKQQTRQAVLLSAGAVVKRCGFAKATTREIAKEAGVSVGTVFLHFPDVGALAEALLDESIGAALDLAFRKLPKQGDLVDRLVHVSKKLFESYDIEPDLSRQYLAASLFRHDMGGPAVARLAQFQHWVEKQITDAQAAGSLSTAIEPKLAFSAFFSLYFGALVAGLRGQIRRRAQLALLEASLRTFFRLENPCMCS